MKFFAPSIGPGEEIVLPHWDVSLPRRDNLAPIYAFCSKLDNVKIARYNVDSVKILGGTVMPEKQYHHKDLRNALIEKGIKLVNSEGLHSFSLRKAAAACGVSHAAPYSHFQSKEELLDAMQQHITEQFSQMLDEVILNYENTPGLLKNMGVAYISFFIDNPHYFSFIYSQSNAKIDLTFLGSDAENFRPFVIYKTVVSKLLERVKYPAEKQNDILIALWAFIHGLTALATMNNVTYDGDWRQKVIDYMDIFALSFLKSTEG